jgi:hypothetical protein
MPARAFVADAKSYTNTQTSDTDARAVCERVAEWFILALRAHPDRRAANFAP